MLQKTLKSGVIIPALGFGTWEMGGRTTKDDSADDKYIQAIETAIQSGYRHIDTAEIYGDGHTETLLARAKKGYNREELIITSKVAKFNLAYENVLRSAEKSLERLETNYLDLYLVHHPNPEIPVKETMKAMDELVDKGMVRSIGVSNFNVKQLKEAREAAKHPVDVNQLEYNLQTRNYGKFNTDMEKSIIPYCRENKIQVVAWRPLAKGQLDSENSIIKYLMEKYDKSAEQVALNWLIHKKGLATVAKATSRHHIRENFHSADFQMEEKDYMVLDMINKG
ncbi:MAG: aldo/keto reductase [Bacteroidales bacterium]|nr:aldo/keto reductase [Bacteroidales bacterium]MCF8338954.1 aldo/keto reductase [Bacteroidales bacterium]